MSDEMGDTPVLDLLGIMTAASLEATSLDPETLMLVTDRGARGRGRAAVLVHGRTWASPRSSTSTRTGFGASSPRSRRSSARRGWRRPRGKIVRALALAIETAELAGLEDDYEDDDDEGDEDDA